MTDWISVDTAPKDGSKFIGLYSGGEVYTTWWAAFHTYMTDEEKKKYGHNGFHPNRMRYDWNHIEGDSMGYGVPIGWMPLPEPPND